MPNPSLTLSKHLSPALTRSAFVLALLAVLGVFSLAAAIPDAGAATKRIVLGKASNNLEPNCGKDFSRDCIVEGKVTGYQVFRKGSDRKNSFRVPFNGKLVSWSISLSRPTKGVINKGGTDQPAQLPFFNDLFGSPASARVAVLRQVDKNSEGPPKWKMVRQSPVQILNPYFGRTVHFALSRPLNVIRKQVIALTIPTWAPAVWKPRSCSFNPISGVQDPDACARAEKDYTWRGGRAKDKCSLGIDPDTGEPNEALAKTGPQQKVDSERRYGCYYGSNVLLYTATVIGKN